MADWLRDFFSGVGKTAGGAVGLAGTAVKGIDEAVLGGARKNKKLVENFAIMKGNFAPEIKEQAAREILQTINPKVFETMLAAQQSAYRPTGEELLSPAERKTKAMDPAGYRHLRGGKGRTKGETQVEAAENLAKIHKAKSTVSEFEDLSPEQAAYFQEAVENVIKEGGFKQKSVAPSPPAVQEPATEIGKRAQGMGAFVGPPEPTNIRDFFTGGVDPFADISKPVAEPKDVTARMGVAGFAGMGWPYSVKPETGPGQAPATLADLGLSDRDSQQQFNELQKGVPDLDLRDEYVKDPETYKKLLAAIRSRKITIKDAVALIKESMAQ